VNGRSCTNPAQGPAGQGSDGISAAVPAQAGRGHSFISGLTSALIFWQSAAARKAAAAIASGTKRKFMHQSLLQPVLLTWPFLLWGIIIIACYAIGINQLAAISGPIATFNMVSTNSSMLCRCKAVAIQTEATGAGCQEQRFRPERRLIHWLLLQVNFVAVRTHLFFYNLQELVGTSRSYSTALATCCLAGCCCVPQPACKQGCSHGSQGLI
jgi:hypothetical protein